MRNYALVVDGEVVDIVEVEDITKAVTAEIAEKCVLVDESISIGQKHVDGVFHPAQPSQFHEWDEAAKKWIVNDSEKQRTEAHAIRIERDKLLAHTDFTQLEDAPFTPEEKILWATYRQELRDITQQEGFPGVVDWPVRP